MIKRKYEFIVKCENQEVRIKVEASYLKEALDTLKAIIIAQELKKVNAIKHFENEVYFNVNVAFLAI